MVAWELLYSLFVLLLPFLFKISFYIKAIQNQGTILILLLEIFVLGFFRSNITRKKMYSGNSEWNSVEKMLRKNRTIKLITEARLIQSGDCSTENIYILERKLTFGQHMFPPVSWTCIFNFLQPNFAFLDVSNTTSLTLRFFSLQRKELANYFQDTLNISNVWIFEFLILWCAFLFYIFWNNNEWILREWSLASTPSNTIWDVFLKRINSTIFQEHEKVDDEKWNQFVEILGWDLWKRLRACLVSRTRFLADMIYHFESKCLFDGLK